MTPSTTLGPRYVEAVALAADLHRHQVRKGKGIPYLSHVLTVSALVLEDGGSEEEAIAALLHDALEDGGPGARGRVEEFGPAVLQLVQACTDDEPGDGAKRGWRVRKNAYVAHLEHAPGGALRITAADKLHNLRTTCDDLALSLAREGTAQWPRSTACVHQNLWYYAAVAALLQRRLPGSRTTLLLHQVLEEVVSALVMRMPEPSPQAPTCTSCEVSAA